MTTVAVHTATVDLTSDRRHLRHLRGDPSLHQLQLAEPFSQLAIIEHREIRHQTGEPLRCIGIGVGGHDLSISNICS
jgi:hypothetical protein